MLEPSSIHAAIGQCITRAMPEHVNVYSERKSRSLTSPFNHPADPHTSKRLPPLVHEYIRAGVCCSLLLASQTFRGAEVVTFQVVAAIN